MGFRTWFFIACGAALLCQAIGCSAPPAPRSVSPLESELVARGLVDKLRTSTDGPSMVLLEFYRSYASAEEFAQRRANWIGTDLRDNPWHLVLELRDAASDPLPPPSPTATWANTKNGGSLHVSTPGFAASCTLSEDEMFRLAGFFYGE
ncbi:hypothetical protein Pan181_08750 [Aeoliella mucimassa]|uniref:Lipoprotein n=1 Tax=Aeoliella mucimassa TaxID=2527972 RepID=A0A518AIY9_9BACT|nr:hypothetical protein Pan181_08750 [Aeoliella mucimassa]